MYLGLLVLKGTSISMSINLCLTVKVCPKFKFILYRVCVPTLRRQASSSSRRSGDSFEILDIPFDAHVLPGCGKRVECFLPVVCVADEDEINALVTSVVCQRHVCNIPLPVVGVSLARSSTTAKVVIGWAEANDSIVRI